MFTFVGAHNGLAQAMIIALAGEEQKKRLLPAACEFKKICCFALTEPLVGSDASNIQTYAEKTEDGSGYLITGQKHWIGNGTISDYIMVWARNRSDGDLVQGFLVEKGAKGLHTEKMMGKMALRTVQNASFKFKKVFVPANNRLEKATNFAVSANLVLKESRVSVGF
jgi:alkylation response protein AidB-like acyl-CoA dehydrogenase